MSADRLSADLLMRLKVRAADPGKRTGSHPSQFTAAIQTMDLAGLLGNLMGVAKDLGRAVEANRAGIPDPEINAKAAELAGRMTTPAPQPARGPEPASEETFQAAEAKLGFALPLVVRQLYASVGNGGFGPGEGLLTLDEMAAEYHELTASPAGPRGQLWPAHLLPLVRMEPSFDCIDTSSGAILAWDVEELAEGSSNAHWERSFKPAAADLQSYLEEWLAEPAAPFAAGGFAIGGGASVEELRRRFGLGD
jgi:SMI1/KNR4 family protein SUKH-1